MKKVNTIYWATSSILSIGMLLISFLSDDIRVYSFAVLITCLLLIPNFLIKKSDFKRSREIEQLYLNDCDPQAYLEKQEQEYKKMFHTKMAYYLHEVRKADFYSEIGSFNKTKEILENVIDNVNEFNSIVLALYYKTWISYFIEYGDFTKVQVLLEQLQALSVDSSNSKMNSFAMTMYYTSLSKYNVYTSRDLENTEKFFIALINSNQGKVYTVVGMYYLGLIALENGDRDKALLRLKYVAKNGNKLYLRQKAVDILNRL